MQHLSVVMPGLQELYYIITLLILQKTKGNYTAKVIFYCYLKLNETMLWLKKLGCLCIIIFLLKGDSYTDSLSYLLLLSMFVPVSSESQQINNNYIFHMYRNISVL